MIQVSDRYRELADADARNIEVSIDINNVTYNNYTDDDIIDFKVYRSIGSGGFTIGNAISNYCKITLATKKRIRSGSSVKLHVRFLGDTDSEWLRLGTFWATDTSSSRGQVEVTAHDRMYNLDKRCRFSGSSSNNVSPLSFPCTMQQMLDYIRKVLVFSCDFQCEDFTVEKCPLANENAQDDSKYYTYRQILGFIAGAHGANVYFNNENMLVFRRITDDTQRIEAKDCIDQNIDSEEPFTVLGLRLQVGENYIFINDTGGDYNDEMEGILEYSNPLGSIAVAEYIWKHLGNFSYYSCDFTRRGRGWIETGDLLSINDNVSGENVNILVQSIELELSASTGFNEHIASEAESEVESSNRTVSDSGGGGGSGGGGSGVGKFTNEAKNSEIFNEYTGGNTAEGSYCHTAGVGNRNSGNFNSICGGAGNTVSGSMGGIIGGGQNNAMNGNQSGVFAGQGNSVTGNQDVIAGGGSNKIGSENGAGQLCSIGGGSLNTIEHNSKNCTIGGGNGNTVESYSESNTISGGKNNTVAGSMSGVLSGEFNNASGSYSTIAGGQGNVIDGKASNQYNYNFIGGGQGNKLSGRNSVISGGGGNSVSGSNNFVGAGEANSIGKGVNYSAIASGNGNEISVGAVSFVGNNFIGAGREVKIIGFSNVSANGVGLVADRDGQALFGSYNAPTNGKGVFVIGNGTSDSDRSNLFVIYEDGTTSR